jgi:hypothetical protein
MASYWKSVRHRAALEAATLLRIESRGRFLMAVALGLTVILALFFWGSGDAARDELVFRGAGVAFVVFLFPIVWLWKLITVPEAMNGEIVDKMRRLEEELTPRIALDFESSIHGCVEDTKLNNAIHARFYRIKVSNLGGGGSTCEGSLVAVLKDGAPTRFSTPLRLTWAPAHSTPMMMYVAEGIPAYLDVAYLTEGGHFDIATENFVIPYSVQGLFNEKATYRLMVALNDGHGPSKKIELEFILGNSKDDSYMRRYDIITT